MKKEHTRQSLLELLKPYRTYGDKLWSSKKEVLLEKAYKLNLITKHIERETPKCTEYECWIPLRDINNKIVEWTLIDKVDYDNVNKISWCLSQKNNLKYAISDVNLLHIFLLGKAPEDHIIDHKNNNGLDNTRKNLRFSSKSLNAQNKKKKEGTSSKYYGVCKSKWGWKAQFNNIHLGYFKEEVYAAFAYDTYIKLKYNGEGKINNIEKPEGYIEYVKKVKSTSLPRKITKIGKKFQVTYYDLNNKKNINLGKFETVEQASKVYEDHKKKEEYKSNNKWTSQPILKNVEGIAIVPVKTNTKETLFALVDDDLWHNLMRNKWYLDYRGYVCGSKSTLHQHVIVNNDKNKVIDHIYSKMDNRRKSLRINTYGGNNHHKAATGELKLKGICIVNNKFKALISLKKKHYHLGYYTTKEIAAYAYNNAAVQLYGDMASLNNNIDKNNFNDWEWDKDTMRLIKKPQDFL